MDSQLDLTRLTSRAAYNLGEGELRVMLRDIHKQKGTPGFEPGTC